MRRHLPAFVGGALALGVLGAGYLALNPGVSASNSAPSVQTPSSRGAANGEWRYQGADAGSTRYSPLSQVTPANFER